MDLISTKYIYACDPDYCDCLIELTTSDKFGFPATVTNITCPCGRVLEPLSVVGATILPITEQKEDNMETMQETYNPNALVTYKKIVDGQAEYVTTKVTELDWAMERARQDAKMAMASYEKEVALEELIKENYLESGDQGTLLQIAELFNIALTKDVEFVATIEISGTVTVDLTDEDALQTLLENSVHVSSYDGDLDVSDYVLVNYEER